MLHANVICIFRVSIITHTSQDPAVSGASVILTWEVCKSQH